MVKNGEVLVDYKKTDYKGFLFVVHDDHGLMLLRCTRKKSKGPHWQVPGGHVDEPEFIEAGKEGVPFGCHHSMFSSYFASATAKTRKDRASQLLAACKMGAARELFEETGIDMRSSLHRLEPASLRTVTKVNKEGIELLRNEHKHRLFFFLSVTDKDFPSQGESPMGSVGRHLRVSRFSCIGQRSSVTVRPNASPPHSQLKLSIEHSGFLFQPEPTEAADMLKLHSGGKVSEALLMAMDKDSSIGSPSAPPPEPEATDPELSPAPAPSFTDTSTPARRRSKFTKEHERIDPIDLTPRPERKGLFACWCFNC